MPYTRITALWSGAAGLPGYSRFKFNGSLNSADALAACNRVRNFFLSFQSLLPTPVNITFSDAAQIYNDSQELIGEVTFVPPAGFLGLGSGVFAAPVGVVVNWVTGAFINGRKVRGRTFLVPLVSSCFSIDGTPSSATLTQIVTGAQALSSGTPSLVIAGGKADTGFSVATVNGGTVPDRAAILRSRRD